MKDVPQGLQTAVRAPSIRQGNQGGGGVGSWYQPHRDVSALTPWLIQAAFDTWEDDASPLQELAKRLGVTDEQAGQMAIALADFVCSDVVVGTDSVSEAADRAGLSDIPIEARAAVYAMLGEVLLATFWHSIRAVVRVDANGTVVNKQYSPEEMARMGRESAAQLRMGKWSRRWGRFKKLVANTLVRREGDQS